MRRNLEPGAVLKLKSSDRSIDFTIDEVLGVGGSCIAYKVFYNEGEDIVHNGILKEFCPAFLCDSPSFTRIGTEIIVPADLKAAYDAELQLFYDTYKKINQYLFKNTLAANYHTVQIGIFRGNNTAYTLTSSDCGRSYDKTEDKSLYSMLKIMISVTKAVEMYHSAGFLHLDIKPKNILILDGVEDLVKLFDFDSLTSIEKLKCRADIAVPAPEDYYVPELENCDLRNITVQTDVFEIGAMLFSRIFGRKPEISEMSFDSEISFDNVKFVDGISPGAVFELRTLFKNTIQISRRKRYADMRQLRSQLEKILSLISENEPHLLNMPKWQPAAFCIGRTEDVKNVKHILNECGYIFVKGMGGIGKSELSKLFAQVYAADFHTVQFCKYEDSLKNVVAVLPINGINDDDYTDFDALVNAKSRVLHNADSHTLLVVDNFNVTHDDFLRDFLPASADGFKVIFTTRCEPASEYYEKSVMRLDCLPEEDCVRLFSYHAKTNLNENDEKIVRDIAAAVEYNTLVLILSAASVRRARISIFDMYEKLKNQEIEKIDSNIFHEYDFSSEEARSYNKMYAHLNTIFDAGRLSDDEKTILKTATLIPPEGLSTELFIEGCEKYDEKMLFDLADLGWLDIRDGKIIHMHPVLSDLFAANSNLPKSTEYYLLAYFLEDRTSPDDDIHISVALSNLSCVKHLERRYKTEDAESRVDITIQLGACYLNIYRPNEAKACLESAIAMSNENGINDYFYLIYYFMGDMEQKFGSVNRALDYFKASLKYAKKEKLKEHFLIIKIMGCIAECYRDNCDIQNCHKTYKKVLKYSIMHSQKEYTSQVADMLTSTALQLNLPSEEKKYKKISQKYKKYETDDSEQETFTVASEYMYDSDFENGLRVLENYFAELRDKVGEESPYYKAEIQAYAMNFAAAGKSEQAVRIMTDSLDSVSQSCGKDSVAMARQLTEVASVMKELYETQYAVECVERAIRLFEKNNQTDDFYYFEAKMNQVAIYQISGRLTDAKKIVESLDFNKYEGIYYKLSILTTVGPVLFDLSKYDIIEPICLDIISENNRTDSGKAQAYNLLALIQEQKGDIECMEKYVKSFEYYYKKVKGDLLVSQLEFQYHKLKARLEFRRGDPEKAYEILESYIESIDAEQRGREMFRRMYTEIAWYAYVCGKQNEVEKYNKMYEDILREFNQPDIEATLFHSNLLMLFLDKDEMDAAEEQARKILKISPNILNPKTYYEAIPCANIAWWYHKIGDDARGIKYLLRSVNTLARLGAPNGRDCLQIKYLLASVYISNKNYDSAYKICKELLKCDDPMTDPDGEFYLKVVYAVIDMYLAMEDADKTVDFVYKQKDLIAEKFGVDSDTNLTFLVQIATAFRYYGIDDYFKFASIAKDILEKAGMQRTRYYAETLNLDALYLIDNHTAYIKAKKIFIQAKEIFEELNETEDETYRTILENIEHADKLLFKMLVDTPAALYDLEDQDDE